MRSASVFRVASGAAILAGAAACLWAIVIRGPLSLGGVGSFGPPSVLGIAGLVALAAGLFGFAADTPLAIHGRGVAGSAATLALGLMDTAASSLAEGLGVDALLLLLGFVAAGFGAVGLGFGLAGAWRPSPVLAGLLIVGGAGLGVGALGIAFAPIAWVAGVFVLVGLGGLGGRVIAAR